MIEKKQKFIFSVVVKMSGVFISKEQVQLTNAQKWWASFVAALIFILISAPFTYSITNGLFGHTTNPGGPTAWGLILHAIVFLLIIRLLMW